MKLQATPTVCQISQAVTDNVNQSHGRSLLVLYEMVERFENVLFIYLFYISL